MHPSAVTEILVSASASVMAIVALAVWRWIRRTSKAVLGVVDTIEAFGRQWAEAASLAEQIRHNTTDIADIRERIDRRYPTPRSHP